MKDDKSIRRKWYTIFAWISLLITILDYAWVIYNWVHLDEYIRFYGDQRRISQTYEDLCVYHGGEVSEPGKPLPTYSFFLKEPTEYCYSFLKIKTSSSAAHIIKLIEPRLGKEILSYYIPAGETREIEVPTGTYELRYCSGTRWFGNMRMFGRTAAYSKADRLFTFSVGQGYEITLYQVLNGNLRTRVIDPEDF